MLGDVGFGLSDGAWEMRNKEIRPKLAAAFVAAGLSAEDAAKIVEALDQTLVNESYPTLNDLDEVRNHKLIICDGYCQED